MTVKTMEEIERMYSENHNRAVLRVILGREGSTECVRGWVAGTDPLVLHMKQGDHDNWNRTIQDADEWDVVWWEMLALKELEQELVDYASNPCKHPDVSWSI